jgi:hypothetical protein
MRRAILADTSPASPLVTGITVLRGDDARRTSSGLRRYLLRPTLSPLPALSVIRPAPCAYVYAPSKLTAGYCRCNAMFLRLRAPAIIREPVSCRSVLWIQISDYHGQGSCQMR